VSTEPNQQPVREIQQSKKQVLTSGQRIGFTIVFFMGLLLVSPVFMPGSIACAAILLLQNRNKKVSILGLILVSLQLIILGTYLVLQIQAGG